MNDFWTDPLIPLLWVCLFMLGLAIATLILVHRRPAPAEKYIDWSPDWNLQPVEIITPAVAMTREEMMADIERLTAERYTLTLDLAIMTARYEKAEMLRARYWNRLKRMTPKW